MINSFGQNTPALTHWTTDCRWYITNIFVTFLSFFLSFFFESAAFLAGLVCFSIGQTANLTKSLLVTIFWPELIDLRRSSLGKQSIPKGNECQHKGIGSRLLFRNHLETDLQSLPRELQIDRPRTGLAGRHWACCLLPIVGSVFDRRSSYTLAITQRKYLHGNGLERFMCWCWTSPQNLNMQI